MYVAGPVAQNEGITPCGEQRKKKKTVRANDVFAESAEGSEFRAGDELGARPGRERTPNANSQSKAMAPVI
jgi:hypothetical protein